MKFPASISLVNVIPFFNGKHFFVCRVIQMIVGLISSYVQEILSVILKAIYCEFKVIFKRVEFMKDIIDIFFLCQ